MSRLQLYTFFHLNLSFSSISPEQRSQVVKDCYTPLLDLAQQLGVPLGIEASADTLQKIHDLDPRWIGRVRKLIDNGQIEFIGSGLVQLIGPLVPAAVNKANLALGTVLYDRLLGQTPQLALINEQAYSGGMVDLYSQAGYQGVISEWDNPFRDHTEWESDWRYQYQLAEGAGGGRLPLIWNHSIAGQKIQRYAHGDLEVEEIIRYLMSHRGPSPRSFTLYGGDAEVFDYRPGRYQTEAQLHPDGEWNRLRKLLGRLQQVAELDLITPGQVVRTAENVPRPLRLESLAQPIPVKKQGKYNITRWGLTGRADLDINTRCWRAFEKIKERPYSDPLWTTLCRLWRSDFRTHITAQRWETFCSELNLLEQSLGLSSRSVAIPAVQSPQPAVKSPGLFRVERRGRFLTIDSPALRLRLNCRKGLSIDSLRRPGGPPVCGTIPHGYFDDIGLGADWYSGHCVLDRLGQPKVTDLDPVEPEWNENEKGLSIRARSETPLGVIRKEILVSRYSSQLEISYRFEWAETRWRGSFRLGYVTLIPETFDSRKLRLATHNGGGLEEFDFRTPVSHGQPVSFQVSASQALGVTEGVVEVGDDRQRLAIAIEKSECAALAMVHYQPVGSSMFARICFSLGEVDETVPTQNISPPNSFRMRISVGRPLRPGRRMDAAVSSHHFTESQVDPDFLPQPAQR